MKNKKLKIKNQNQKMKASLIVLAEWTNFPFYKISIRLEIAELAIASYS